MDEISNMDSDEESSSLSTFDEEDFSEIPRDRPKRLFDLYDEVYGSEIDSSDDESVQNDKNEGDIQDHALIHGKLDSCTTFAGLKIESVHIGDRIKIGQRVVRGKDWDKKDEDGGVGNVGTVVKIFSPDEVGVQWDSQDGTFTYRTGDGKYDLRLYDNAQTGAKHKRFGCDMCNEFPIRGMKWRCRECHDYDLCTECYMEGDHDQNHIFEMKQDNSSVEIEVGSQIGLQYIPAYGVFPFQEVSIRDKTKKTQKVQVNVFVDENVALYKCDAKVKWPNEDTTERYPVARDGESELVCKTPADGVYYYEDHLPSLTRENKKTGLRVVELTDEEESVIGTIVNNEDGEGKNEELWIKWDTNEKPITHRFEDLKIFDNSQIGIRHLACCDICDDDKLIKGIRWKCTICNDYDLCTECYMSNKDDPNHLYERIQETDKRTMLTTTRQNAKRKKAVGIFKDSEVFIPSEKDRIGVVEKICKYKVNIARNAVNVDERGKQKILQLRSEPKQQPTYYYFPDHLPDLGNDTCGYIKARDSADEKKKMLVKCWFLNKKPQRLREERPRLFIIFANNTENDANDDNLEKKINEFHKISKKTKMPCHLLAEKILIFEDIFVVHKDTTTQIVKILQDIDGIVLNRGDIDGDEGEIMYFKRMAECCCGDLCLPVIISLKNGKMKDTVQKTAAKEAIPIISFKQECVDAVVITYQEEKRREEPFISGEINAKQHVFDVKTPWARKRFEETDVNMKMEKKEIGNIRDLRDLTNSSFDALVCYLLIGVSMADPKKKPFGKNSEIYPNALSMYLLKEGKWKIPKDVVKGYFSHRSIEYICEKRMDREFKDGLWQDLWKKSNGAYVPPSWKKEQGQSISIRGNENNGYAIDQTDELDYSTPSKSNQSKLSIKRISELYGLIFYALLRRNFHEGAKQLIETGGVKIRYILVGCVILKEAEEDWRTTQLEKERMNQLQKVFTHQALRIISCMHESDNPSVIRKRNSDLKNVEEELGEQIQHAGRLLLNHGCLTDAIKTKNKTFLGNNIVKDILNQMWYGNKALSLRRCLLFLVLTLLHVILLPLLMINMENKPLRWLYRFYKIPVMKVLLNLVGLLALLIGYAYMLLFDFEEHGISISDLFVMAWMVSFFLDETKQLMIALHRRKFKSYITDKWNILDWLSMGTYLSGMLLKIGEGLAFAYASRIVLVFAFAMLCIRILNLFCISELLGPKLVIIQKMFLDTFAFMSIMTVITICYNVSYYTILYTENSEFSFDQLEKVTRNGYWMLFGELNLETDRLTEPDCTFNKTIYMSGAMERCPSELGRFLAPYFKALYGLVAVILMLNLLIAMYSYTFSRVQEKSELYWTQLQTNFLEEYSVKSIFPIHMQLPALVLFVVQLLLWLTFPFFFRSMRKGCKQWDDGRNIIDGNKKESKFNNTPMFVRVFLYDTNFDIELPGTRNAEGYAALRVKGEMNIAEKDKLTVLQDEMKEMEKNLLEKHEKVLEDKIIKLDSKVQEIKDLLLKLTNPEDTRHESTIQENENSKTPRRSTFLGRPVADRQRRASRKLKFDERL